MVGAGGDEELGPEAPLLPNPVRAAPQRAAQDRARARRRRAVLGEYLPLAGLEDDGVVFLDDATLLGAKAVVPMVFSFRRYAVGIGLVLLQSPRSGLADSLPNRCGLVGWRLDCDTVGLAGFGIPAVHDSLAKRGGPDA